MFYFHKKHPKSHIEKIYYFPIAIIATLQSQYY